MKYLLVVFLLTFFCFRASTEIIWGPVPSTLPKYSEKTCLRPRTFSPNIRSDLVLTTLYVSDEVNNYICEALRAFKEYSLNSESINWSDFEYCFYLAMNYCSYTWQTYPRMHWVMTWLKEKHSHFSPPKQASVMFSEEYDYLDEIKAKILDDNIAYLLVPQTNCDTGEYAAKMRALIRKIDQYTPDKWVIDLRGNLGGDCWEMLAGISPFLDRGTHGYFGKKESAIDSSWIHNPGEIILKHKDKEYILKKWDDYKPLSSKKPKIAILIDSYTASAGETVVIAFKTYSNVKFFGTQTCGVPTGISLCTLSDGSLLGIASCYEFDRNKEIYKAEIMPDFEVSSDNPDDCLSEAIRWLTSKSKQKTCLNLNRNPTLQSQY